MDAIQIDKYTWIQLQETDKYGIQLQEGWIGREGTFKPSFCKREIGPKGDRVEKTMPVSIKLGERDTAIKLLRKMADYLESGHDSGKIADEDVPF